MLSCGKPALPLVIAAFAAAVLGLALLLPRAAAAVFVLQLSAIAPANAVLHKILNLWRDQLAQRQALLGLPR